ncbi:alpha/beta hydrolase family protein [Paenibacillus oceani]|uniref:Uncharacterized protein n=1 Tax=Paenibacillus oceani TaxID=2772510 RepID=A0A927C926_9BACL|nr:hypothetical protein [Paenibacillus oceani]MBD2862358.1 hypothetical protein [Paenibacillus oceani]
MELMTRYYDEDIVLKRAVDIVCPAQVSRRVALFYIHGGGWRAGARDGFHRHACVSINGPATLEKWEPMHEGIKRDIENLLGVTYEEESPLFRDASPMAYAEGEAADFLFLLAGKEKFFPHSFIYEMSEKLQRLSKRSEVVLFPEAEHGFFYGVGSPLQQEALTVLEPFLESYA